MSPTATDNVWYLVPTKRPGQIDNIFRNVESQSVKGKLLIIENGDAVGACEALGRLPDVVLRSEANVAAARNAGLSYVRSVAPEAFIIWMDDDDQYHRSYARKCLEGRGEHVSVASWHFAEIMGHYFYCQTLGFMGASMAGPQRCFRMADKVSCGEEGSMLSGTHVERKKLPVLYRRGVSGHTWQKDPVGFLNLCQPFVYLGTEKPSLIETPDKGALLWLHQFVVKYRDVLQIWKEERKEAETAG